MNLESCYCGGSFVPTLIAVIVKNTPMAVHGYRCNRCGEELMDNDVAHYLTNWVSNLLSADSAPATASQPSGGKQA